MASCRELDREVEGEFTIGCAANAIPSEGSTLVCIPPGRGTEFLDHVVENEKILKSELGAAETGLSVTAADADKPPSRRSKEIRRGKHGGDRCSAVP